MPFKDIDKRRESARNWNRENPEMVAAAVARYREKVKTAVLDAYGGACRICREVNRLELHHKNRDGAAHRKEVGESINIYRWAYKNGCPQDRLELLCESCHKGQHEMERDGSGRFARAKLIK